MSLIKGPAIFLAQFADDKSPYNNLENITAWAKSFGYEGVQIPSWDKRFIDLDLASTSKIYCDELKSKCNGLSITELATHLQGQLIAVHPIYSLAFEGFAPKSLQSNPDACQKWAVEQIIKSIKASANLGLSVVPTFSGSFLWPFMYPWPQRPSDLVNLGFKELASRWLPLLNIADEYGIDLAYELHPGEDLHDGVTFERFLKACHNHKRIAINYDPSHFVLQCMDYVEFISIYKQFIKAFHVKDAEYRQSARSGVYGGYLDWKDRPGRFRSLGDGMVDFRQVFTKMTEIGYSSWAVLEWECCIKDSIQGAKEGAKFISDMLITPPSKAFDDFSASKSNDELNRKLLGLESM